MITPQVPTVQAVSSTVHEKKWCTHGPRTPYRNANTAVEQPSKLAVAQSPKLASCGAVTKVTPGTVVPQVAQEVGASQTRQHSANLQNVASVLLICNW